MSYTRLPRGFLAGGIHAGTKKKRKDLSIFFSEDPCACAAIFTKNTVKAAPVLHAIRRLRRSSRVSAVVVSSGNANCMTGKRGISDTGEMSRTAGDLLGVPAREVLVSATGIIGRVMDMGPVLRGLPVLVRAMSRRGLDDAADGIMTTDSFRKTAVRELRIGGKTVRITGVAKGAGMIHPEMATMLCYIMTDAAITEKALKKALRISADTSLNAITVDGDMSTNDTVMVLANGRAGNPKITSTGRKFDAFTRELREVAVELSKDIVRDGEGASKFIEVRVNGARTVKDARAVAGAVAGSLLVKCAVLGGDPNWGRIASSAGSSGVRFDVEKIEIKLDGVPFYRKGRVTSDVDRKSSAVFKGRDALIEVDLHAGRCHAVKYTCDISKKYITLNSFYTT